MRGDCHIHVIMDGVNYRQAVDRHWEQVQDEPIRQCLAAYRDRGITFLREGGDARHVSERARELAPEYGLEYRTPLFAIHKRGHYGGIVGYAFETWDEYRTLVAQVREKKGDFIKIITSGLIDFTQVGTLSEEGLDRSDIREMIHIAHEEGFAVMSHTNGARNALAAIEAGVDSLEHGAFLSEECLDALAESHTVWVPTLSPCLNMLGTDRYDDGVLREIGRIHGENIRRASEKGALLAVGSDAGAWQVPHGTGTETEERWMAQVLPAGSEERLDSGLEEIRRRFRYPG